MGADLISYLLVGPRKIAQAQIKKAEPLVVAWLAKHKDTAICENCGQIQDAELLDRDEDGKLLLEDVDCDECGAAELVLVSEKYPDAAAAKKHLRAAVDCWHAAPSCRDAAVRTNPDNPKEIIICCGELSWGDEPDGAGYNNLKTVCRLPDPVKDIFGIR